MDRSQPHTKLVKNQVRKRKVEEREGSKTKFLGKDANIPGGMGVIPKRVGGEKFSQLSSRIGTP